MFFAENAELRSLLRPEWKHVSREETAGTINRSLFLCLNHIFIKGFKTLLSIDMLIPLDSGILSASKPVTLQERWDKGEYSFLFED